MPRGSCDLPAAGSLLRRKVWRNELWQVCAHSRSCGAGGDIRVFLYGVYEFVERDHGKHARPAIVRSGIATRRGFQHTGSRCGGSIERHVVVFGWVLLQIVDGRNSQMQVRPQPGVLSGKQKLPFIVTNAWAPR